MTDFSVAYIMQEACYRLAGLSYAGIEDYDTLLKTLDKYEVQNGRGTTLPNNPYEPNSPIEAMKYIHMIVESYHQTVDEVLETKGIEQDLFENSGFDLERIISANRVRPESTTGIYFAQHNRKRK